MARPKGSPNAKVSETDLKHYVLELKRKSKAGDTIALGMLALVGIASNPAQQQVLR